MSFSSVPYWRRFARNYGTTNARFYSSDFGSDLFIGDLVLSRESSSCAGGNADSALANYLFCAQFFAIELFVCAAVGAQSRAFQRNTRKQALVTRIRHRIES